MGELEYTISVEPANVLLEGPYDKKVYSNHTISNPGKERVAIKMKTNNGFFRITPSHAFIEPEVEAKIAVCCTPWTNYDPSKSYLHRVVVQYAPAPADFDGKAIDFWKSVTNWRDIKMPVTYSVAENQQEAPQQETPAEDAPVPVPSAEVQPTQTDKLHFSLHSGVVYSFSCGDCQTTYIGQTMRHMHARLCEHLESRPQQSFSDPPPAEPVDLEQEELHCPAEEQADTEPPLQE